MFQVLSGHIRLLIEWRCGVPRPVRVVLYGGSGSQAASFQVFYEFNNLIILFFLILLLQTYIYNCNI